MPDPDRAAAPANTPLAGLSDPDPDRVAVPYRVVVAV